MTKIKPVRIIETRKTYLPHLLAIACLWLVAMTLDYHDQAAESAERAERISAEFTACQQGKWRAVTEQGVEIGCMPVEINEPRKRT